MELIVGREKETNNVLVTIDGKNYKWDVGGSVPKTVSKQHCVLKTIDGINIQITNLKQQNVTWVNGMPVSSFSIQKGKDKVELGVERYVLDWSIIDKILSMAEKNTPKEVDIMPLKKVWEDYQYSLGHMQKKQAFVNACRGGVSLFTIGGVAAGYVMKESMSEVMPVLYVLAVFATVLFVGMGVYDALKMPKRKEQITRNFTKKYCCPHCHYFFGFQSFDIFSNNMDCCPKCRSKFKKEIV